MKFKLLVTIALVVIASTLSVGILSSVKSFQALTVSTETTLLGVSEIAASKIDAINQEEITLLHSLALMPVIKDEKATIRDKYNQLTPISRADPVKYENISYYDADGNSLKADGSPLYLGDRIYFKVPRETGQDYIGDPTLSPVTNEVYMYYSVPVKNDKGQIIGVISSMIRGNRLSEVAKQIDVGGGAHPDIINMSTGVIVGSGDENAEEDATINDVDSNTEYGKLLARVKAGETGVCNYTDPATGEKKVSSFRPVGGVSGWTVLCKAPYEYYYGAITKLTKLMLAIMIVAILAACLIAGIVLTVLIKPLVVLRKSMEDISSGNADLTKRIPQETNDEVSDVIAAFNKFTEKLQGIMVQLKSSKEDLLSVGDKLGTSTQDTSSSITQIIASIESVHHQVNNQNESVLQTAGAVNEIASNIESLEKMIENQSTGVSQASSAVEQMIGNISQVNQSVDKMANAFSVLISSAQNGSHIQQDVSDKIEIIRTQSETLKEANLVISSIAEQTNLLAMNAAIEAAHAGEAGKGFSVVADEIRKLSETSGNQSKTIGEHLVSITNSISTVVDSSEQLNIAFKEVTDKIQQTDEIVRQIKNAMDEQTEGSKQINEALHIMNDNTGDVRNASREMAEGNKLILKEIQNLQDVTSGISSSMDEMAIGAEKINATGSELTGISGLMSDTITDIGSNVDQFKV